MTEDSAAAQNIQRLQKAILATYYALLAYFIVSAVLVFGELRAASLVIWVIQVTPLLIFAKGLHTVHFRTYGWMSFVILLYFMHGVLIAFDPQRLWLGIVEASLSTVMFVLIIFFIRQYREHYKVPL